MESLGEEVGRIGWIKKMVDPKSSEMKPQNHVMNLGMFIHNEAMSNS